MFSVAGRGQYRFLTHPMSSLIINIKSGAKIRISEKASQTDIPVGSLNNSSQRTLHSGIAGLGIAFLLQTSTPNQKRMLKLITLVHTLLPGKLTDDMRHYTDYERLYSEGRDIIPATESVPPIR